MYSFMSIEDIAIDLGQPVNLYNDQEVTILADFA